MFSGSSKKVWFVSEWNQRLAVLVKSAARTTTFHTSQPWFPTLPKPKTVYSILSPFFLPPIDARFPTDAACYRFDLALPFQNAERGLD
jgi:hypothetical protein